MRARCKISCLVPRLQPLQCRFALRYRQCEILRKGSGVLTSEQALQELQKLILVHLAVASARAEEVV